MIKILLYTGVGLLTLTIAFGTVLFICYGIDKGVL